MAKTPGQRVREAPPKKIPDADGVSTMVRYSPRITERICDHLARGEAWVNICKAPGMPSYNAYFVWQKRHPEFARAVALARQAGADLKADRALEVAQKTTSATVQADRLHVGTLLKHAALIAPRQWGARAAAGEGDGAGGGQGAGAHGGRRGKTVLEIRIRRFERVVGPDGIAFVRELKPEGEARKRGPRRPKDSWAAAVAGEDDQ